VCIKRCKEKEKGERMGGRMLLCPGCENKKGKARENKGKHLTPISARFSAALLKKGPWLEVSGGGGGGEEVKGESRDAGCQG